MHYLFVYGQLMTRGQGYDCYLRGEMRMRVRTDPAARFGPDYTGRVYGQVHQVSTGQLAHLARIERPQYALKRVGSWRGAPLWAFEDVQPDWDSERLVPNGKWR